MRRHIGLAAFAAVCLVAPAHADDAEKAAQDYKEIETWMEAQKPKTADDRKAIRVELGKKLRAFLKEHPSSGRPTFAAKNVLAEVVSVDGKHDEALALYEDNLKNGDDEFQQRARWGVVKTLVDKKDLKGARTRLDAFMKEKPDEKNLVELDDYLKKREGAHAVTLKVGAKPPALKAKTIDGKEVDLAALRGKVVLIDFWATWCPPCKKDLPSLKKLHAELGPKGFEVVGVDCFEKDWDAYKTFIEKEQLAWPQVSREDAKPIARDYGVEHLPRTVLVGKKGEIVAVDLRGDQLAAAVRAAIDGKDAKAPEKKGGLEPGDKPVTGGDE